MKRFTLRTQTTDLDRFKIMVNRKQRSYEVRKLACLKKSKAKVPAKVAAPAAKGGKAKGKK